MPQNSARGRAPPPFAVPVFIDLVQAARQRGPVTVTLKKPTTVLLPAFADALKRGWSPDNLAGPDHPSQLLEEIERDPEAFVATLDDAEARGRPITRPDGSVVPRLPGFHRWIFDGEQFCGSIGFRWQPGSSALPSYVLGHIGYAVVPWMRGKGYATAGLRLLLPVARAIGLEYVELTTDADNIPSQRVIISNGGYLVGPFKKDATYGGTESLRYRIVL